MSRETVTRLRAPLVTDDRGGQRRDWDNATRLDIHPATIAPRQADTTEQNGRQGIIVGLTLYLPADSDVLTTDRLEVRDVTYDVEGEPGDWRHPLTGRRPGLEVNVRRVDG